MQVSRALTSYHRTRSGLVLTGLAALALGMAGVGVVTRARVWTDIDGIITVLAVAALLSFVQSMIRLIYTFKHRLPVAPALRRSYAITLLCGLIALAMLYPTAQLFLHAGNNDGIDVITSSSPCGRDFTGCLCEGSNLLPDIPESAQTGGMVGFPFVVQELSGCPSFFPPRITATSDVPVNYLSAVLDVVAALVADLALVGIGVLVIRRLIAEGTIRPFWQTHMAASRRVGKQ